MAPEDPTIAERAASHRFPRLANQYQLCCRNEANERLFDQIHLWDLAVLDAEIALAMPEYLGRGGRIRAANPQALLLAYFSAADINEDAPQPLTRRFTQGLDPGWYLRDARGAPIRLYQLEPGHWTLAMNQSTPVNEYLPRYLAQAVLATKLFDGIFYDWATTSMSWLNHRDPPLNGPLDIDNDGAPEPDPVIDRLWTRGYSHMLAYSRLLFPPGTPIVGNAGWNTGLAYSSLLNGVMIERFLAGAGLNDRSFGWAPVMRTYARYSTGAVPPRLSILMANSNNPRDFQFMRFALASALMFDGYFCFTNDTSPSGYQSAWWYDEYAVDLESGRASQDARFKGYLGNPLSEAVSAGRQRRALRAALEAAKPSLLRTVWRRDFEQGIVLVNPAGDARLVDLGGWFRRIRGENDPGFNNGESIQQIRLLPRSGAILLRGTESLPVGR